MLSLPKLKVASPENLTLSFTDFFSNATTLTSSEDSSGLNSYANFIRVAMSLALSLILLPVPS